MNRTAVVGWSMDVLLHISPWLGQWQPLEMVKLIDARRHY